MKVLYRISLGILCLSFFLSLPFHATAQKFAPPGAVWLYENSGKDTSIHYIRIRRIQDTSVYDALGDTAYQAIFMYQEYLRHDSSVAFNTHIILRSINPKGQDYTAYLHGIRSDGWTIWCPVYNYLRPVLGNFFQSSAPNEVETTYPYPETINSSIESLSMIHINDTGLLMIGLTPLHRRGGVDPCLNFCSLFIERIGYLNFFFHVDACASDTIYAGNLIWYEDDAFERWYVPDSLKPSCNPARVSGLSRQLDKLGARIYPNPFTSHLSVTLASVSSDPVTTTVYDMNGKVVYRQTRPQSSETFTISLDEVLPSGLYILHIQQGGKQLSQLVAKR